MFPPPSRGHALHSCPHCGSSFGAWRKHTDRPRVSENLASSRCLQTSQAVPIAAKRTCLSEQVKVMVGVPLEAAVDSGDGSGRGGQRAVYYFYHYHRNYERHVVEKLDGNVCAFCLLHCSTFKVRNPARQGRRAARRAAAASIWKLSSWRDSLREPS